MKKNPIKKSPQPEKASTGKSYYNFLGLLFTILLGILLYSNSFSCSFHLDDVKNIVNNKDFPALMDFEGWCKFSQTRLVAFYSLALNIHFNEFNVWGFHLVNMIIHLINACLVWWLTVLILSTPVMRDHPLAKHKNILAFITALLFVSHPLATQSVTYIIQRMSSMAAMFYMLSIVLYVKGRIAKKGNVFKYLMFVLALLSAVLAMLTKQNAYTLPFAILLVEFFFLQTGKVHLNFKDYRLHLILASLVGFIILITLKFSFSIFKPIPPNEIHALTLTPITYLLTQFSVITKYIQLLFIPVNQMLDYDFPVSDNFFEIRTLLSFLFLISLIMVSIYLYNRNRIISFGILWFFLTLIVESSIIPINDVIFEHRTYLPSFGFFLIVSTFFYGWIREKNKLVAFALLGVILVFNSISTYQRNKVWKDGLSLWSDNISKAPNTARPYFSRGVAHGELGQWNKAIADYSKAIAVNSQYSFAYSNRGVAHGKIKEWSKAVADYTKAIELDPDYASAYFNRGTNYGELGQWENAINDYTKAIEFTPKYVDAYSNRGIAYGKLNQWDKSIADYTKAIEIDPKFAKAYYNRGNAFGSLKEWAKAIEDYTSAIANNPKYANAYNNRGAVYDNLANPEKAVADYNIALKIDPNFKIAQTNREKAMKNLESRKK